MVALTEASNYISNYVADLPNFSTDFGDYGGDFNDQDFGGADFGADYGIDDGFGKMEFGISRTPKSKGRDENSFGDYYKPNDDPAVPSNVDNDFGTNDDKFDD